MKTAKLNVYIIIYYIGRIIIRNTVSIFIQLHDIVETQPIQLVSPSTRVITHA